MKDNVEGIQFYIKSRGVQDLVLMEITFEKSTRNFYFENDKVGIRTVIANLRSLSRVLDIFSQNCWMFLKVQSNKG